LSKAANVILSSVDLTVTSVKPLHSFRSL
jgi:hypothetical protein